MTFRILFFASRLTLEVLNEAFGIYLVLVTICTVKIIKAISKISAFVLSFDIYEWDYDSFYLVLAHSLRLEYLTWKT